MRAIAKYRSKFGRIVVAVTLLAVSSGITVAHHACRMEGMQCCAMMVSCGSKEASQPIHQPSIGQSRTLCCTNTISGGLNNLTALFENQNNTGYQKLPVPPLHPDFSDLSSHLTTETLFFIHHTEGASPPPVEKYILFASLLI